MELSPLTDLAEARKFVGQSVRTLPVPSFVVDSAKIRDNVARMHAKLAAINESFTTSGNCSNSGTKVQFRPHIKTLKTVEATRLALGDMTTRVVASTVAEIQGLKPLLDEGRVQDVLYGLPLGKSVIPQLAALKRAYADTGLRISAFVDHPAQLELLLADPHAAVPEGKWSLFVKVDSHDNRAGVPLRSEEYARLLALLQEHAERVELAGFYVHAGTSYGATDKTAAKKHLHRELDTLLNALRSVPPALLFNKNKSRRKLTLSFGATPTAHALAEVDVAPVLHELLGSGAELELHAGNFLALDLQQASSTLAAPSSIAGWTQAEIVSFYRERNEYLVNAGVLALTREPGRWGGLAHVRDRPGWKIVRVSQEHGLLAWDGSEEDPEEAATKTLVWGLGERVDLLPQHMCITAAMHALFFVVDGDDTIVDVWKPWKFW
jgi:D-serine deaminase-like pyridoxal phosphate-dependent protein